MCMRCLLTIVSAMLMTTTLFAQNGKVGLSTVRSELNLPGAAARNALVSIVELKRAVLTDDKGQFTLEDIPVGEYHVIAHLDRVPDVVKTINVVAGKRTLNFNLTLASVSEQVTVTASGSAEAVSAAYQSVKLSWRGGTRAEEFGIDRRDVRESTGRLDLIGDINLSA